MKKVLVIGTGNMGRNHIKTLLNYSLAETVLIYDENPDVKPDIMLDQRVTRIKNLECSELREVDYAVVATPTKSHLEVTEICANTIPLILVEKPLAMNTTEAKRFIEIDKSSGTRIAVGHIERFNPAVVFGKSLLKKSIVGDVYSVSVVRQGPRPVRVQDVGVIFDLGSHDIDLVSFLFESDYAFIKCETKLTTLDGPEDLFVAQGILENGVIVSHNVNWISPVKERRIQVLGSKGTLTIDTLHMSVVFHASGQNQVYFKELSHFQGNFMGEITSFAFEKHEPLLMEHRAIEESIKEKYRVEKFVGVLQGAKVIEILESLKKRTEYRSKL